jgi:oligopeptide transport system substrate-binding protein
MRLRFRLLLIMIAIAVASSCGEKPQTGTALNSNPQTIVRRGNGGAPGSLDPALAEDVHAFNILTDIYEGLVALSADGRIVPAVADSWAVSDDGLTYSFHIRDGVRWSNGEDLLAKDFVSSFRRLADPTTGSAYSFLLDNVRNFSAIQAGDVGVEQLAVVAIDSQTLQFKLERPAPYFLSILTMPVAMPVFTQREYPLVATSPDEFVGNGAFVLSAHTPGGEVTLRKNPNYWDEASVQIDAVVHVPVVDPLAEFNMYRAGQLDITNTIPPAYVQMASADFPDQVQIAPSLALYYLAFDVTEEPLDNRELRAALSMAIDRSAIVSVVGRGETPAYGVVPPGVSNYARTDLNRLNLPDDERELQARELYSQAGYSADRPLRLELTYDVGDIHERIAVAVGSMWHEVLGVDVSLQKMEWQYFLDTRDNRTEWQVMRFAWTGDYDDASTFTNIFRSGDLQNLSAYSNPEYDRILSQAEAETEPARRAELIAKAEQVLLNDHPIAPLYYYVSKHLVQPAVTGYEQNVLDRHPSKFLKIRP